MNGTPRRCLFVGNTSESGTLHKQSPIATGLFASTEFSDVQFDSFGWERTLDAASYATLISTYSDHSTLPPVQFSGLIASVQNGIERH
jgi:hypothetical protein